MTREKCPGCRRNLVQAVINGHAVLLCANPSCVREAVTA